MQPNEQEIEKTAMKWLRECPFHDGSTVEEVRFTLNCARLHHAALAEKDKEIESLLTQLRALHSAARIFGTCISGSDPFAEREKLRKQLVKIEKFIVKIK